MSESRDFQSGFSACQEMAAALLRRAAEEDKSPAGNVRIGFRLASEVILSWRQNAREEA